MSGSLLARGRRRWAKTGSNGIIQPWLRGVGLAGAVGVAYYVAGRLGVGLILKPEGVAVFWPAAGISSGVLIALGRSARWPVALGVLAATVVVHVAIVDPLWAGTALGACNAAEALITAGIITAYFGTDFRLDRLDRALGFFLAAIVGSAISGLGGAVTYRLMSGPSAEMLTSWQHWFASDAIGIVIVAPLVIGIGAAIQHPLTRQELTEGAAALTTVALMTMVVIFLPLPLWETVLPIAALFLILLWISARCRPVYAAAAVFLVSITFVATAVFDIGHFGDVRIQLTDRILQAQSAILFVAIGAFVLAALFAEAKDSEARLSRSNMMLERERDNKLMSAQAITATIAHEVRQPLAAIATNASAARRFLLRAQPDHTEIEQALSRIIGESQRTSEVFDNIRALFRTAENARRPVDLNEVVRRALKSLNEEARNRGVAIHVSFAVDLPPVAGHAGQLQEVMFNLAHNAIEAMASTADRSRVLQVRTEVSNPTMIAVAVEDSGPGIDPKNLDNIFGAFFTTKTQGMGLGLAICRMIIEHHGGHLTASSDGKSGAVFQFVLPVESASGASSRPKGSTND
ncbi:MAG: ATP-binding protein [Xanthobacteraceae bacterium]